MRAQPTGGQLTTHMTAPNLNWIANYIWGIAHDVFRDVYVRGKYRDVILPMTVLRRLDAVLEPTKQGILDMKATLDAAGVAKQDAALRQAAEQAFTSVIGDFEDDESREPSRRLMKQHARGEVALVLSAVTLQELERAPRAPEVDHLPSVETCLNEASTEVVALHQGGECA